MVKAASSATVWQSIGAECRYFGHIGFSPGFLLPKVAILLGIAYMFGPWDIIPNRLGLLGHVDEAGFVLAGLAVARLLAPSDIGGWPGASTRPGSPALDALTLRTRSALLAAWLVRRREFARLRQRIPAEGQRLQAHLRRATATPDLRIALFRLVGYRLWWALQSPFARAQSDMRSIVVIGGSPRSGTTLLRSVLGRHPMICSGPETTVFLQRISAPEDIGERMGWNFASIEQWQIDSRSQMEFIERFANAALQRAGKTVWAEKTPHNVWRFAFVRRRFPHAKIVHIVRDGRDVVCSLRKAPFSKVENAAWNSAAAAQRCALQWRRSVQAGLRFRGKPGHYELRYEDLVRAPEPTLRRLMAFLDVPWNDNLLTAEQRRFRDEDETKAAGAIFETSIGRWRQELSVEDCAAVDLLLAPSLRDFSYEP